jgi:acyl-[acyl carrier protein]--UDP-N-acetylglucosamine O-acyltransferase
MNLSKLALVFCSLFLGVCSNLFAQSSVCENAIQNRYSGNAQDRYGNSSIRKISMLNYYTTHGPGMHKFGNNNALLYIAIVDKYENGQIRDRDTVKLWCVVNPQGKVLGLERDLS